MGRNALCVMRCALFCILLSTQYSVLSTSVYGAELKLTFIPSQGTSWQNYILIETLRSSVFPEVSLNVEPLAPADQEFSRLSSQQLEELKVHVWLHGNAPKKYQAFLRLGTLNPFNINWRELVVLLGVNPTDIEQGLVPINIAPSQEASSKLYLSNKEIPVSWSLTDLAVSINEALPKPQRHKNIKAGFPRDSQSPPVEALVVSGEELAPWAKIDPRLLENLRRLPLSLSFQTLQLSESGAKELLDKGALDLVPAVFLKPLDEKAKGVLEEMAKRGGLENKDAEKGLFFVRAFSSSGVLTRPPKDGDSTLKLFIMSQCPFGVSAQRALLKAMQDKKFPQGATLKTNFIVTQSKNKEGSFEYGSLHGKGELEEDIRQLVMAHHFPDKLSCYLEKRLPSIDSSLWVDVLKACKIPANKFQKLYKEQGLEMLAHEHEESKRYGVTSSPTFIWKDKFILSGLDSLKNLDEFKNVDLQNVSGGNTPAGKCQ